MRQPLEMAGRAPGRGRLRLRGAPLRVRRRTDASSIKHLFENHDLETQGCGQFIDVTDDVVAMVARSGVVNGMVLIYSPHTTCAVVINERESGFIDDFNEALDGLVPTCDRYYRHDDLRIRTEGLEDDPHEVPNGHSHVRAALLSSPSQAIPIVGGRLLLGRYQRIFFCELDRARPRKFLLQAVGQ
jgi:secondary thiamine-phosphate synthase enzyme